MNPQAATQRRVEEMIGEKKAGEEAEGEDVAATNIIDRISISAASCCFLVFNGGQSQSRCLVAEKMFPAGETKDWNIHEAMPHF